MRKSESWYVEDTVKDEIFRVTNDDGDLVVEFADIAAHDKCISLTTDDLREIAEQLVEIADEVDGVENPPKKSVFVNRR